MLRMPLLQLSILLFRIVVDSVKVLYSAVSWQCLIHPPLRLALTFIDLSSTSQFLHVAHKDIQHEYDAVIDVNQVYHHFQQIAPFI